MYNNKLVGFFSLNINNNLIELLCLYVFEECRNKSIATYVLNDILFTVRHNYLYKIEYIVANSFVDSSMFFLKNGFSNRIRGMKRNPENIRDFRNIAGEISLQNVG